MRQQQKRVASLRPLVMIAEINIRFLLFADTQSSAGAALIIILRDVAGAVIETIRLHKHTVLRSDLLLDAGSEEGFFEIIVRTIATIPAIGCVQCIGCISESSVLRRVLNPISVAGVFRARTQ